MTLASYYDNLEKPTPPKTAFLRKLVEKTGKDIATVRLWVKKDNPTVPREESDRLIISELTGIPTSELWPNEAN